MYQLMPSRWTWLIVRPQLNWWQPLLIDARFIAPDNLRAVSVLSTQLWKFYDGENDDCHGEDDDDDIMTVAFDGDDEHGNGGNDVTITINRFKELRQNKRNNKFRRIITYWSFLKITVWR